MALSVRDSRALALSATRSRWGPLRGHWLRFPAPAHVWAMPGALHFPGGPAPHPTGSPSFSPFYREPWQDYRTPRSVRPPNPVSSELPSHPGVCGRRVMPPTTPTSPEHRYPGGRAAPEPGDHRLTLTWADESQTRPLSSPDTLKMTQCVVRTPSGMGSWGTEPEPLTKGLQGPLPPWPGPPSAGGKASATSF